MCPAWCALLAHIYIITDRDLYKSLCNSYKIIQITAMELSNLAPAGRCPKGACACRG
jgi:hypothetical protein